jgi:hypothetical protein
VAWVSPVRAGGAAFAVIAATPALFCRDGHLHDQRVNVIIVYQQLLIGNGRPHG